MSFEERTEDWAKEELKKNDTLFFTKTENITEEIEKALKEKESKSGGKGGNRPDLKMMIETESLERYPVMIEVKGTKGALEHMPLSNRKKDGSVDFSSIKKYAVNGALHYAEGILENTSFSSCFAVGINGYEDKKEIKIYFLSKENYYVPKLVGEDLSFLFKKNWGKLVEEGKKSSLSEKEKEKIARNAEDLIEGNLKRLNQMMQDDLNISVGSRVELITGMIMAGLGTKNGIVAPLKAEELKGQLGIKSHDGQIFLNKISDFLSEKELPEDKRDLIITDLQRVFCNRGLYTPENGESKLKVLYSCVEKDIIPYIDPAKASYLDFTGKLFNVLTEWVDIPDGGANDVVLTPRYVTAFMCDLAEVNKDSYVWDYTLGTGGFLVSAMKKMLEDAERIPDLGEREAKKRDVRSKQLLGIEKRPDIYLLAVLNMILMGDGTSNILQADSLKEFDGSYAQGSMKGKAFPATVYLSNPPYSAEGKGLIFAEKALSKMTCGRAAVLIQENAGAGNGGDYAKDLLRNNTLIASIHMADIFKGKAGVQTAVYVFSVGIPHDPEKEVVFIDMSDDGYTRQNRKKASVQANLKDTGDAAGRYKEASDIVCGRKKKTDYYREGKEVFKDTISLEGDDWTFAQHVKYDTIPTEEDFMDTVGGYLSWKVSQMMK